MSPCGRSPGVAQDVPFGAPRVGGHDDTVPPLGDVLADPLQDGGLRVQIVHGDVEESLRGHRQGHTAGLWRREPFTKIRLEFLTPKKPSQETPISSF